MKDKRTALWVVCVLALVAGGASAGNVFDMGPGLTSLEFVTVGDAGNDPDTQVMNDATTGYGGVDYVYRMGMYEVTNAQYSEFLNAKAAVGDPYGLYNSDMGGGWNDIGGISRAGSGTGGDPWVYSTRANRANRPVNYVCWFDAIRFANWLQNGQGSGDTESGTYPIVGGGQNSGTVGIPNHSMLTSLTRKFMVPTEDEWYKAAYYKGGGTNMGYWDYATQSDAPPTTELPPGTDMVNGSANYASAALVYLDTTDYTTEVGAYAFKPSDSAYGTFDQSGNTHEWTETLVPGPVAIVRGGSYGTTYDYVWSSWRDLAYDVSIDETRYGLGFRIAQVPEPATLTLLALGAGLLIRRRKPA